MEERCEKRGKNSYTALEILHSPYSHLNLKNKNKSLIRLKRGVEKSVNSNRLITIDWKLNRLSFCWCLRGGHVEANEANKGPLGPISFGSAVFVFHSGFPWIIHSFLWLYYGIPSFFRLLFFFFRRKGNIKESSGKGN